MYIVFRFLDQLNIFLKVKHSQPLCCTRFYFINRDLTCRDNNNVPLICWKGDRLFFFTPYILGPGHIVWFFSLLLLDNYPSNLNQIPRLCKTMPSGCTIICASTFTRLLSYQKTSIGLIRPTSFCHHSGWRHSWQGQMY